MSQQDAETVVYFGRHRGKRFGDLPQDYLRWMVREHETGRAAARRTLEWLAAGNALPPATVRPDPVDPLAGEPEDDLDETGSNAGRREMETHQHGKRLRARTGIPVNLKPMEDLILTALRSGQPLLQINTAEIDEVLLAAAAVCRPRDEDRQPGAKQRLRLAYKFDRHLGVQAINEVPTRIPQYVQNAKSSGTLPPTSKLLADFYAEVPDEPTEFETVSHVLVLENFHAATGPSGDPVGIPAVVQNLYVEAKGQRKTLVVICPPRTHLPPEIASLFQVVEHAIPEESELRDRIESTVPENVAATDIPARAASALRGLPYAQAEAIVGEALVKHGRDETDLVARYCFRKKLDLLNQEGLVELYEGKETFADVGGLDGMKAFTKRAVKATIEQSDRKLRGRGILMCGIPGSGKSLTARAIGNECGIPTLKINLSKMFGSLVGETEAKTARVFDILRKHAPACCYIDEIDKALPKLGRSSDGGVSDRMLGTFLQHMGEGNEPLFWLFAANSVEGMSSAMFRADRLDATFFVGFPDRESNRAIWRIYLNGYGLDAELPGHRILAGVAGSGNGPWTQLADRSAGWTPAEIASCCRQARLHGLSVLEASQLIIPWSSTSEDEHAALKKWAVKSALCAVTGKPFVDRPAAATAATKPASRRRTGDFSDN